MKKSYKAVVAAMLAMSVFAACSKDEETAPTKTIDSSKTVELEDGASLSGKMWTNVTLKEDCTYTLSGKYYVQPGLTLTIEPGVTIESDYMPTQACPAVESASDFRYILVQQGAKIEAKGTAAKPIVMTVQDDAAKVHGAWGGIHICGKAPINSGTTAYSEIGNYPYGGTISDDDSGTLEYVILEYTGQELDGDSEANGISFYGVGSGTTVNNVHAYKGSDDGFEFFGGTVNISHMVVTDCQDDSIDWTEGWVGTAQYIYVTQTSENCDCLFECDTNSKNETASPISCPKIANATLLGADKSGKTKGINLKVGSQIKLYNSIVSGKTNSIVVDGQASNSALIDGQSVFSGVALVATETDAVKTSKGKDSAELSDPYTVAEFKNVTNNNQIVSTVVAVNTATVAVESTLPSGLKAENFIGAFTGDLSASWVDVLMRD